MDKPLPEIFKLEAVYRISPEATVREMRADASNLMGIVRDSLGALAYAIYIVIRTLTSGIEVPAAGGHIHPHYGVFTPTRTDYVDLVAKAPWPAGAGRIGWNSPMARALRGGHGHGVTVEPGPGLGRPAG